ncbi:DNA polymerase III gamma subunit /DNA polymerase III tau subunit [Chromohalobacter marismortui]|uniref:DNA polymerase III subunit gamma/tau n=1 Tax=Chromohalobacter marismortui TaxID=42055 RepID=A0A4R7NVW7_9GAMM|nr:MULTISPECIES: DNA polymerase III subunit gamma/tau [Chromohalobacter]MCI0510525.1 DNA polymerase III subunit gamma/tau [Chromohalobacter sp.]MCI0594122.1 DNA polymerase III subunit gamma/tau [Chromohalobacter sp.]TDU24899.1 DNA polymerase III gamma subunit /DNA polymerase III tau subunit [Chromohalobacter marismortui]
MSYQVLARKWRPRTFHELVGQEHVSRALVNALDQGRLHHAYLFTGTRGVGKTTLARILAKCLNCRQGVTSVPCGECETCREIDEGRFVDLIEVDAASRTKVEDTRELLDNVQYAPTQGRYKVYLIDEVHMLSTHSFNALLKTLEEPPPHVKFLLATTDPQKLPVTVLSRCLQFTLKNMPPERVVGHLSHILEAESVAFDEQALWLLGKAAEGSMRDALSLTDQAIAFGQGEVRHADVAAMLGTLDHRHLLALAEALAEVDAARVLQEVANLAEQGPDFGAILDDLAGIFHRLAIAQMVPDALDNGHGDRDTLLPLAARFTAEDVQLYYQIALQGRGDMESAPDPRTALEMTLLRMLAFRPQGVPKPPQTPLPIRGAADGESPATAAANSPAAESAPGQPAAADPAPGQPAPPETQAPAAGDISPVADDGGEDVLNASPEAESPEAEVADVEATSRVEETPPPVADAPDDAVDAALEDEAQRQADAAGVADVDDAPPWALDEAPAPAASEPSAAAPEPPAMDVVAETAEPEPATPTPVVATSETGAFDHGRWLASFDALALGGLTRNLAAHCIVEHDDGATLALRLDPSQGAMLADVHVERLTKALADQGIERRLNITVADLPEGLETPRAQNERLARERHAQAVEALRRDPHIQMLEHDFGAHLLERSVTPTDGAASDA